MFFIFIYSLSVCNLWLWHYIMFLGGDSENMIWPKSMIHDDPKNMKVALIPFQWRLFPLSFFPHASVDQFNVNHQKLTKFTVTFSIWATFWRFFQFFRPGNQNHFSISPHPPSSGSSSSGSCPNIHFRVANLVVLRNLIKFSSPNVVVINIWKLTAWPIFRFMSWMSRAWYMQCNSKCSGVCFLKLIFSFSNFLKFLFVTIS